MTSYVATKKKNEIGFQEALIMSEWVWLTLTSLDVLKALGLLFHFFGLYFQNKQSVFMYNFLPNMTHQNSSDKLCYTGQLECQYSHYKLWLFTKHTQLGLVCLNKAAFFRVEEKWTSVGLDPATFSLVR